LLPGKPKQYQVTMDPTPVEPNSFMGNWKMRIYEKVVEPNMAENKWVCLGL